ncbi:MAG: glycosyltransferase, partial [Candidatus Dojkabacteria bacterium]
PLELLIHPHYAKVKVINLHNIHSAEGYFPIWTLPFLSRKARLFWTLHDAWAVHGKSPFYYKDSDKDTDEEVSLQDYPAMGKDRRRLMKWIKKQVYKLSKIELIVPSKALLKHVKASGYFPEKTKFHHVPNGIKPERFSEIEKSEAKRRLGLPNDKTVIYMQAGWVADPKKGILGALESFQLEKPEDYFLVITGNGAKNLEELLPKDLGGYKLEGYVDNKQIPDYFAAADLYLFPSWFENFSTTLLEAAAAKTPAICFDIGGNSEIVLPEKTGEIVAERDYKAFWDAVVAAKSKQYKEKNFEEVSKKYTIENCIAKYIEIFDEAN